MPGSRDRIRQDVNDISCVSQLLGYAAAGQVEQLLRQRRALTQGKIAQGAGFGSNDRNAGSALSAALRNGLNDQHLQRLDEIIGALAPDLDGTGGLSSLSLRLTGERGDQLRASTLTAHVPPSWTGKILQVPAPGEFGVLIQASALLSAFLAADKMDTRGMSITSIRDRYGQEMDLLVRRLILISVAPPTSRNYDAQILLGSLASYAFDSMRDRLEYELRSSPLGFRVWRAITKLVKISGQDRQADALKVWVRHLIRDAEDLRKTSLYPDRGLDLETAITVPAAWSPPEDDWIADALRARAWNREATIRERGTAAMGLWQRAVRAGGAALRQAEEDVRELIAEFRNGESQPDAAGFRWIAVTLRHVIDREVAVCNDWPDVDEPWFRRVQEAADELDKSEIPDHLRGGTKSLFRHMLLQNAGVYRRHAIETVVTSGWNEPITRALGFLLRTEKDEAWLRVRAEFALGILQRPDQSVEAVLRDACLQAYQNLKAGDMRADELTRSRVAEMHSSLFAVGDCFGVAGAGERAKSIRERLRPVLTELADLRDDRATVLQPAVRAAAYLLIVTAQPRIGLEIDVSQELLEKLSGHPDDVTARLSRWALKFQFAGDGTIRPLHSAADHGIAY